MPRPRRASFYVRRPHRSDVRRQPDRGHPAGITQRRDAPPGTTIGCPNTARARSTPRPSGDAWPMNSSGSGFWSRTWSTAACGSRPRARQRSLAPRYTYQQPPRRAAAAPATEPAHDEALFARLRALRRELADAADLPPYVVFSDRSLAEMATYFPQSEGASSRIHGVGRHKLAAYGESFLAASGRTARSTGS